MSLRFHEIAESNHRILNPFNVDKLMLIGEICQLQPDRRQLDLACGKGELLCSWSKRWGTRGTGVDISKVFLAAAHQRAIEYSVDQKITFIEADAGTYLAEPAAFDVVSCIGATWIGGGLVGTLALMEKALAPDGVIIVGEPYWVVDPPAAVYNARFAKDDFSTLVGTLDRIESTGFELVEMVLASLDDWDRYEAMQWWSVHTWLKDHPDDPDAAELQAWIADNRRYYLQYERQYLGWGVFVLKRK